MSHKGRPVAASPAGPAGTPCGGGVWRLVDRACPAHPLRELSFENTFPINFPTTFHVERKNLIFEDFKGLYKLKAAPSKIPGLAFGGYKYAQ